MTWLNVNNICTQYIYIYRIICVCLCMCICTVYINKHTYCINVHIYIYIAYILPYYYIISILFVRAPSKFI